MKAHEVVTKIEGHGGAMIRQRGSHRFYRVEVDGVVAHTIISGKNRDDIPAGLLSKIDRDLAPALGKGWTRA